MSFKMLTLALLKPEVVAHPPICWACVKRILANDSIKVVCAERITLYPNQIFKFYETHTEKFFFNRLVAHIGSGPLLALILSGNNVISDWRDMIGQTKVYQSMYSETSTLRSDYGLTDFRNLAHGSDSEDTARQEIDIMFEGVYEGLLNGNKSNVTAEQLAELIFKPNISSWTGTE